MYAVVNSSGNKRLALKCYEQSKKKFDSNPGIVGITSIWKHFRRFGSQSTKNKTDWCSMI